MFLGMRFSASDREKKNEKSQSAIGMGKQYKSQKTKKCNDCVCISVTLLL